MQKSDILVPIKNIKGVGKNTANILMDNKIFNTYALVNHFPKSYDNYFETDIDLARHNEVITIIGRLDSIINITPLKKVLKIDFDLLIKTYKIKIILFRPKDFLTNSINLGDLVIVKGKYNLYKNEITATHVKKYQNNANKIIPKYQIEGIFDSVYQKIVSNVFLDNNVKIIENLPDFFLKKHQLLNRYNAYYNIHLPKNLYDIDSALKRFKYEEALYLQLAIQNKQNKTKREPIPFDLNKVKEFINTIPYTLTKDQKEAVNDIFRDFKNPYYSFRLIQGDVGSGKTIVATIGLYGMVTANKQVAIMAPTEILANQHYELLKKLFKDKIRISLLTQNVKDKNIIKESLKNKEIDVVIGTQSLIQDDVIFNDLGLVIIDEQHRFGIKDRESLKAKNDNVDTIYLSATPIPRTLAISFFGDIDISSINEKPKNRLEVKTFYYSENKLNDVYQMMHKELNNNNKVFVVVPAIDSLMKDENIKTVEKKIKKEFDNPIFLLHGKLKKEEIKDIMNSFENTDSSILISTTMIEVGIDIKEATVMVIFAAENFGLSQLHQLRGRIGRNDKQSYCFLISKKEDVDRLSFLATNFDGFKLSEYDLLERGPGEFIGLKQSGKINYRFLNFNTDFKILKDTLEDAKKILNAKDYQTNPKYIQIRKYLNTPNS
ncbi:ATP-dependent DNA helicase RecG [Acholeplasma sp. OttesenSCG-928-E16]|nr:ATP-dependent DNA helicase RecG [Acholeplasma sp. OttesenSCG-928-E16]